MSAANPNPMEKSMVSSLVVANAGGGSPLPYGVHFVFTLKNRALGRYVAIRTTNPED
jgi:hypothetical protein